MRVCGNIYGKIQRLLTTPKSCCRTYVVPSYSVISTYCAQFCFRHLLLGKVASSPVEVLNILLVLADRSDITIKHQKLAFSCAAKHIVFLPDEVIWLFPHLKFSTNSENKELRYHPLLYRTLPLPHTVRLSETETRTYPAVPCIIFHIPQSRTSLQHASFRIDIFEP